MARRLLDEEERECTFRPKVNSNYKAKVKDDAPRTREERLQKLSKDRAATLKKVEALRIEAERREASECTFRPKTLEGRNRELIRRMLNDNATSVDDSLLYAVNGFSA